MITGSSMLKETNRIYSFSFKKAVVKEKSQVYWEKKQNPSVLVWISSLVPFV